MAEATAEAGAHVEALAGNATKQEETQQRNEKRNERRKATTQAREET